MNVFVRCNSHRAREKLFSLLGHKPQGYYDTSWDRAHCTGGYYEIPESRLAAARAIKGVTKAKFHKELAPCWS